jgi:hypothetical protein
LPQYLLLFQRGCRLALHQIREVSQTNHFGRPGVLWGRQCMAHHASCSDTGAQIYLTRLLIDLCYYLDLVTLLQLITLTDIDGVDPEHPRLLFQSEAAQRCCAILRNIETTAQTEGGARRKYLPTVVGKRFIMWSLISRSGVGRNSPNTPPYPAAET